MKLLWVSDGVVKTGFEFVSRGFLTELQGHGWDVHHLAIGATGDPVPEYPWPVYPAFTGGDQLGTKRMPELLKKIQPDVVVISNDAWVVPLYTQECFPDTKVVAYCPVDAPNQITGKHLNSCKLVLAPTNFGCHEIEIGGYTGKTQAIGYGIDVHDYEPLLSPRTARQRLKMPEDLQNAYIIGNVNRNAPRKRIDLTMKAFRRYRDEGGVGYLLLHMNTRDSWGWNILQLANRLGISDKLILTGGRDEDFSVPFDKLKLIYQSLDLQVSTTVGEGWGLTTAEGMACGVAQAVPDYSALGEWARGGVAYYGISGTNYQPGQINTEWAEPDYLQLANHMLRFEDADKRGKKATMAFQHIRQPHFTWKHVGMQMSTALLEVVRG